MQMNHMIVETTVNHEIINCDRFKKWESIRIEVENGLLTDEDIDSTLEEVLGTTLKSGMDYSQFRKVMDILEDIMAGREEEDDDDEDDDDEEEGGNDDDDDNDDDIDPLPVRGKGKSETAKSNSKDKASPVQSFSPGQGFGRPPAPPPTKGKKAAGKKMSAEDKAMSLSKDLYDSLKGKVRTTTLLTLTHKYDSI